MSKKVSENFEAVCRAFGRSTEDILKLQGNVAMNDTSEVKKEPVVAEKQVEKEVVALADTDLDAEIEALLNEPLEDVQAGAVEVTPTEDGPVIEEAVVVTDVTDEAQELTDRLMAVKDAEETSEEDKTTAEELIARLEELKAVRENINAFLEGKEQAKEEIAEAVGEEAGEIVADATIEKLDEIA